MLSLFKLSPGGFLPTPYPLQLDPESLFLPLRPLQGLNTFCSGFSGSGKISLGLL